MSHRDEDSRIVQYNRNMSNKEQKRGETPPYNRALKPARLLNQANSANENKNERPIRQMGNYVRLTHNSSAGTKVSNRGNVGNNKNKEEQRVHTEYVRLSFLF